LKVLVVAPRSGTKIFPVGLAYVVSALKAAGHVVDCLNLNHTFDLNNACCRYDVVATGGLACHFTDIKRVVQVAREAGATTVVGGGIISSEPELMLRAFQADYGVIGEGEVTVCELLSALEKNTEVDAVQGIAYLSDDCFCMTDARKPIMCLDELPYPDYESLGFRKHIDTFKPSDLYYLDYFDHPRGYPVVASRSCPYDCTFCYHPLGRVYRQRSVDSIIEELGQVVPKYRINVLEILDELFSIDDDRLKTFCERITQFRKTLPWELKWGCQLRVENINDENLQMLRDAGCYNLSLGIESYSGNVLDSMRKKILPEDIHRAVHCILKTDLRLQGNFIFGDPSETMSTAEETIQFWKKHSDAGILLGFVQPYPGSELYRYCLQKGIICDRLDFVQHHLFDIFNMTEMPDEDFFRLRMEVLRVDYAHSRYALPEKVEQNAITVVCPHCDKRMTYRNFAVVDSGSVLFSLLQNRLLFNKMMYCRMCGRRFWVRSALAHLFTVVVTNMLKYPALAIRVMNVRNGVFTILRKLRKP